MWTPLTMSSFYVYGILFVFLWKCATSSAKCVKLDVVEEFPRNRIVVVQQNDNVSLTFDVNIDACQNNTQRLVLSSHERDSIFDVCSIVFTNGTCQETITGQPCSCVNSAKHRVQFHQSITGVDYKNYHWTAASNASVREELMEIIFVIRTPATENNCSQISSECVDIKNQTEDQDKGECYRHVVIAVTSSVVVAAIALVAVPLGFFVRRKWRVRVARASEKGIHPTEVMCVSRPTVFRRMTRR